MQWIAVALCVTPLAQYHGGCNTDRPHVLGAYATKDAAVRACLADAEDEMRERRRDDAEHERFLAEARRRNETDTECAAFHGRAVGQQDIEMQSGDDEMELDDMADQTFEPLLQTVLADIRHGLDSFCLGAHPDWKRDGLSCLNMYTVADVARPDS